MKTRIAIGLLLGGFWSAGALAGPKWDFGEDSWIQLAILAQIQGTYDDAAEPESDIFLRRGRIILSGQVTDGALFFAETENVNAGRYGQPESSMKLQDVFADIRLAKSPHWIKAGLILLPFSFETRASAGSLLGLDYNVETIKLGNTFVWRDYGVEAHGNVGKRFAYAAGVFDGYDSPTGTKNPDAEPRFVGHVAWNPIGEVETGWFYSQDRLGKKGNYLTLGLGADLQDGATLIPGEDPEPDTILDAEAYVLDLQSGFRLGEKAGITVNAAWYDWDNATFTGSTAFVESGVLFDRYGGTLKWSHQDPDGGTTLDDVTVGFGYFHRGHNFRVGVEYRFGDSAEFWLAGIQVLL